MLIENVNYTDKLDFSGGYIKPVNADEIHDGYIKGLNDPVVNQYLVSVRAAPVTMATATGFVESSYASASEVLFGIWVEDNDRFVGTVRVHSVEMENKTAEIGICIFDKDCWGKGLGKTAITKITAWLHDRIGIRWVEAGVYKDNTASARLFASAGYIKEYDICEKYLYDGKPVVVEIYVSKKNL